MAQISLYYEIIIFTAGLKSYADPILDLIENQREYFRYRLYRNHTSIEGVSLVKDISWIGRDLSRTMIIDNISDNFRLQCNNGLVIRSWNGDIKDKELMYLIPILLDIPKISNLDIRLYLKRIKDEYNKKGINSYYNIKINQSNID